MRIDDAVQQHIILFYYFIWNKFKNIVYSRYEKKFAAKNATLPKKRSALPLKKPFPYIPVLLASEATINYRYYMWTSLAVCIVIA